MAALDVIEEENLCENAEVLGEFLRKELKGLNSEYIKLVRGKGLLNAIVINETENVNALDICVTLKNNGLLAKQLHGNIIRFAPPLVMDKSQMEDCISMPLSIHDIDLFLIYV